MLLRVGSRLPFPSDPGREANSPKFLGYEDPATTAEPLSCAHYGKSGFSARILAGVRHPPWVEYFQEGKD